MCSSDLGGLGLGYTALEALKDARVSSLLVIEALDAVIDWHQRGLVPIGRALAEDEIGRASCRERV